MATKQLGFLHSHPEVKQPDGRKKAQDKSRLEMFREEGVNPPVQEIEAGQYLLEALFEAGPSLPGPMGGELPLTWAEIHGYMRSTCEITEPWEAKTLMKLSQAYCEGKMIGRSPFAKYPGFD